MALLCAALLTSLVAVPVPQQRQHVSVDWELQSKRPLRLNFHPVLYLASLRAPSAHGSFIAFGGDQTSESRLETSYRSIQPVSTAPRTGVANGAAQSVVHSRVRHRLFAIPSREATAGDDEALRLALEVVSRIPVHRHATRT